MSGCVPTRRGQGRTGRSGRAGLHRCHDDEEKDLGEKLVKGGPLEPTPVEDKNGCVELKVQAAYDARNAYLRFQWKTQHPYAGIRAPVPALRRQGVEGLWLPEARQGGAGRQAARHLRRPHDDHDRRRQGARVCAAGLLADLPRWPARHAQAVHQGRGGRQRADQAIKKTDVRKYLPETRTDPSDWKTGKSVEEIAKIKAAGGFVDLIQWRAHRRMPWAWPTTATCLNGGLATQARTFRQQRRRQDPCAQVHVGREEGRLQVDHRRRVAQGRPLPGSRTERGAIRPERGLESWRLDPRLRISRDDAKGSAADNNAIASGRTAMDRRDDPSAGASPTPTTKP